LGNNAKRQETSVEMNRESTRSARLISPLARDTLWDWDPAGLTAGLEKGETTSDYDEIAFGLALRAVGNVPEQQTAEWLSSLLIEEWGLDASVTEVAPSVVKVFLELAKAESSGQ
jgi:hypothetical protein